MNDAKAAILSLTALILIAFGDFVMYLMGVLGGVLVIAPWFFGASCCLFALYYSFKAELLWVRVSAWLMILASTAALAFGFALPAV